jgi:hypothetical protein
MKILLFFILFIPLFFSCKKWENKGTIPSYININFIKLITDSNTQGASTHKISDVWINVDGNRQGTYEIPVTFPVLATEKHEITIRAGIKVNGIAANRIIYPFFNMLTLDTLLPEGKKLELTPTFSYLPETNFAWMEGFQNNGFSLDRMTECDTVLYVVSDSASNNKWGKFTIDAIRQRFYYKSAETYQLPTNGSAVFLEMDYRCNHPFSVGLLINKLQSTIVTSVVTINPHPNTFNHIYIDFSYTVSQNTDAIDFNVFFQTILQSGYMQGNVEIDNIKLLHF